MLKKFNYKNFLLIPFLFGIFSCVISAPQISPLMVEYRDSGKKYESWDYYTYENDFDGEYRVSMVSTGTGSSIRIFTSIRDNISSFQYQNGDSYICSLYRGLNTEMIFKKDNGRRYNHEVYLSLSTDNSVLFAKPLGGNENQLVALLNMYDTLIIRTTDSCGTRLTNTFDISGTTHLRPMESLKKDISSSGQKNIGTLKRN